MVTREQNGRHLFAVPFDRAGILRIFEQGRKMALELERIFVSEHAWEHTRNGIRKHKRGQLAARHHEIANRNFLVDYLFYNAFVKSLLVTAQQSDIV